VAVQAVDPPGHGLLPGPALGQEMWVEVVPGPRLFLASAAARVAARLAARLRALIPATGPLDV
jgi:hypothetical protein